MRKGRVHFFFLWMGQFMPSLQYLHFSCGTGVIDFTKRPYFRRGIQLPRHPE
jgi:hypothetical protein